jgi:hypothetical protein
MYLRADATRVHEKPWSIYTDRSGRGAGHSSSNSCRRRWLTFNQLFHRTHKYPGLFVRPAGLFGFDVVAFVVGNQSKVFNLVDGLAQID